MIAPAVEVRPVTGCDVPAIILILEHYVEQRYDKALANFTIWWGSGAATPPQEKYSFVVWKRHSASRPRTKK
jgi:hypothetical protein